MSQSYTVTLRADIDGDGTDETRELVTQSGRAVNALDVVREYNTISDCEIPVALTDYSTVEQDWIGPTTDLFIEVNGTLIFRGYASRLEGNQKGGEAIVGGPDIFAKLRRENRVDYSPGGGAPIAADDAVSDFWNTTSFGANVTFLSTTNVATDAPYDVTGDNDGFVTTADEWANNTRKFKQSNAPDTDAIYIDPGNNDVTMYQHSWSREGEDYFTSTGQDIASDSAAIVNDISEYSGAEAVKLDPDTGQDVVYGPINPDYTIPRGHFDISIRMIEAGGVPLIKPKVLKDVDGTNEQISDDAAVIAPQVSNLGVLDWKALDNSPDRNAFGGIEIEKNVDHYVRLKPVNSGEIDVDALQPHDNRFDFAYDNDNGGAGGYLNTPGLYTTEGTSFRVSEYQTPTPANVTEAKFDTITWSNGGGNAAEIKISNDGGRNFFTASPNYQFLTTVGTTLIPRITISGQGLKSSPSSMPTQGIQPGGIETIKLLYDGDDRPIIQDERFSGSDLDIIKALHERAGMRFVADYSKNSLSVASFPRGESNTATYRVKNRERVLDTDGYANAVTAAGKQSASGTPTATVEDSAEITSKGERIEWFVKDPNLTDQADVAALAREELNNRLDKDTLDATVEIVAAAIQPGYRYTVDMQDLQGNQGVEMDLERVEYRERGGEAEGVLQFQISPELGEKTTKNVEEIKKTRLSL